MVNRVTEFADHLHEHFIHPCVVESGAYKVPMVSWFEKDKGDWSSEYNLQLLYSPLFVEYIVLFSKFCVKCMYVWVTYCSRVLDIGQTYTSLLLVIIS